MIFKLLLLGIGVSIVNSFGRADYTLPLFIFTYLLWEYPKFQTRLIYMILFSFLIDTVYILYWGSYWEQFQNLFQVLENQINLVVIICSLILVLIKIVIVIVAVTQNAEVKHSLSVGQLQQSFCNFIALN